MSDPLYVAFTMDCERIGPECSEGGPEDWQQSERAIRGFSELLLDRGYPATLFLMPECGVQHRDLLLDLASHGVELGMHMHPQCFGDRSHTRYLGDYDKVAQKDLLRRGLEVLTGAIGERPTSFRSGNFSANDATFEILAGLDFKQGSVSNPARNLPGFAAVWTGADPDPHFANSVDRLTPGDLDFLEVPLTTDPAEVNQDGTSRELRIEFGTFADWHLPILDRVLGRFDAEEVDFKTLCIFTHNYFEYEDPSSDQAKTVRDLTGYLDILRKDYDVRPVTLAGLRVDYDKDHPNQTSSLR